MKAKIIFVVGLSVTLLVSLPALSQKQIDLKSYFSSVGLSQQQIADIENGLPVVKTLTPRSPKEIFVFGAVYVNALPESYVAYAQDFGRLRKTPGYLAIQKIGIPLKQSDFAQFGFGPDDVKALRECRPSDCDVQLPGTTIEQLRSSVNWSAPNAADQVNDKIRELAIKRLSTYWKEGNRNLGAVYNDKEQEVNINEQFAYVLSNTNAFLDVPEMREYLLNFPGSKPSNTGDHLYWANVKFGLKPTLRIVHVVTMRGSKPSQPAIIIAEKQLYSSHYFETALDTTYCVRADDNAKRKGFYLIQVMGSEQAGLTGLKGSMIRRVAESRSAASLQKSLAQIKSALERK